MTSPHKVIQASSWRVWHKCFTTSRTKNVLINVKLLKRNISFPLFKVTGLQSITWDIVYHLYCCVLCQHLTLMDPQLILRQNRCFLTFKKTLLQARSRNSASCATSTLRRSHTLIWCHCNVFSVGAFTCLYHSTWNSWVFFYKHLERSSTSFYVRIMLLPIIWNSL